MFRREDLGILVDREFTPAVSIYMPAHVAGRETRQDPIRFRTLLDNAEAMLGTLGLRRPEALEMLIPARRLLDDDAFWRHQQKGLAVFIARNFFQCHPLPTEVQEYVSVGKHFYVKPLLPLLDEDAPFRILSVSNGKVRLFEASRFECKERTDLDLPHDVGTETGASVVSSSQQTPKEPRKGDMGEFLRRVSNVLEPVLSDARIPVVIVAQPEMHGHLRTLLNVPDLLLEEIEENPDAMSDSELHSRALAAMQEIFNNDRKRALDQLRGLLGVASQRATTKVEDVIRAAKYGRVDKLFLAQNRNIWGNYDERADKVHAHGTPQPDDEDLLDLAARETLRQGGSVHVLQPEELQPGAVAAAIFRF